MADRPRDAPTLAGPAAPETPLTRRLSASLDGDVRADEYTRHLYATDASLYRALPVAVAFPRHRADVVAAVAAARERGVPVLPRGGGTSLAGQAVNEAVVLDFSRHMDAVVEVDPGAMRARVEPGVVMGELDDRLAEDGLVFPPDPAWSDHSTVGGAIGNNSSGAHSLAYGPTDAYLREVEVVIADGTVATFGPTDPAAIRAAADPEGSIRERIYATVHRLRTEEADRIEAAYPDLGRNVAGYALDSLLEPDGDGRINLARLIAGSEGTLGIVTTATLDLVEAPDHVGAVLLSYDDHLEAMRDVAPILETDPAALETLDEPILSVARDHPTFEEVARLPPAEAEGVLLVEYADDDAAALRAALNQAVDRFGPAAGRAIDARPADDEEELGRFWQLRKSSLPLLLSRTTDAKHVAFVEDAAVPPEALPSFVAGFREILAEHGSHASFYGHAGEGVLHVRPLVDTVSGEGREAMRSIAEAAFELVREHGGTISGEHGDGRARTGFAQRQYGPELVGCFRELKDAFDPEGLLNPGVITGDVELEADHRVDPDAEGTVPFEPALAWENPNGLRGMVELCHGCGGCRGATGTVGGIMCPTYRASDEEIAATRGRANLLREAIRGHIDPETLFDPRFEAEVLDLCIGCKGCLRDCPSGVDMATLKAELRHQRHRRRGATRRERLFAAVPAVARWGSTLAPVSNWLAALPGGDRLLAATLGLAPEREPPRFARTSFSAWAAGRTPSAAAADADRRAVVVPDPYTNFLHPEVGRATVRTLEACGVGVRVPEDLPPPGRAAYSQGFVERARAHATEMVDRLQPMVEDGWSVVVPEPSAAAMLQSDYAHLLGAAAAAPLAEATYGPAEYLHRHGLPPPVDPGDARLVVHDHCHQQSIGREASTVALLDDLGFDVTRVDSGCCGMAGSFGYEAEHYGMSRSIADILLDQLRELDPDGVIAGGSSCRTQLAHVGPWPVGHPMVAVDAARRGEAVLGSLTS